MTMLDARPDTDDVALASATTARVPATAVDIAAVILLSLIALWGFHASFGGWSFFVVGALGLALGVVVGWAGYRFEQPLPVVLLLGVVVVVLFSGALVLRDTAVAAVVPSLETVSGLAQGVTKGWQELVTTPRPVGDSGNLFAIPYLCSFAAGLLGTSGALRSRRFLWAVLPPTLLLAAGIITGVETPANLLLQGGLYAVVVVAWAANRGARDVDVIVARTKRRAGRAMTAAAVVAASGLVAVVAWPFLPGAQSNPRLVLHLDPELDPAKLPSPLSSTRQFLAAADREGLGDSVLFRVTGDLPAGTPLRLAVLDYWDGQSTGVAGSLTSTSSGTYSRVGETIPTTVKGKPAHVTVEIVDNGAGSGQRSYRNVWVPTVGGVIAVSVSGPAQERERLGFRYNLATDTALDTAGVLPGTTFDYDVVIPSTPSDVGARLDADPGQPAISNIPTTLQSWAADHVGDTTTPYMRAKAIIDKLIEAGAYAKSTSDSANRPGHGKARLESFVGGKQIVGDEEQYGAAALLMTRAAGVPSRLVLGFRPGHSDGKDDRAYGAQPVDVKGKDLMVWLEVFVQGDGWVPVGTTVTPARDKQPEKKPQPPTLPKPEVQPPPPISAKVQLPGSTADSGGAKADAPTPDGGAGLPAWLAPVAIGVGVPLALVALVVATITGLKRRRARRRFSATDPALAITGGWAEMRDRALDHGLPAPTRSTRTESAAVLVAAAPGATEVVPRLAHRADAAAFGPTTPSADDVAAYWADVDTATVAMGDGLSWWGRWRARLSLRSLMPARMDGRRRRRQSEDGVA